MASGTEFYFILSIQLLVLEFKPQLQKEVMEFNFSLIFNFYLYVTGPVLFGFLVILFVGLFGFKFWTVTINLK